MHSETLIFEGQNGVGDN